jgi:hypothetical protein
MNYNRLLFDTLKLQIYFASTVSVGLGESECRALYNFFVSLSEFLGDQREKEEEIQKIAEELIKGGDLKGKTAKKIGQQLQKMLGEQE